MKLSYIDIFGDGERHPITVTITTDHHMSSYSTPVIILPDGALLNAESWYLMAYQIQKATPNEAELMRRWLNIASLWTETDAAKALGRLGGRVSSDAKTQANRAKANLPPKEGKKNRGRPRKDK